ncbi:MAG: (E)-4-hydroxy-3-methylbut-2-enyl-diphosphate synthase [Parachlamydiales bacterium]|nr:(E)-4-hydroxy-3-methylbut-2-enyl-diphosphate synthase [Parachlamydiales bacterium]
MKKYCESIFQTIRRPTREVMVGNIGVGGSNPVRIQSMTTSNTRDVDATVEQIIRLSDIGCEIARVTVQGIKEAEACEHIKNSLIQKNYTIPLVADIHFYPPAALAVAEFVDKVRINPGNFVDKRASFKILTYDEVSYQKELDRIEEKLTPLIEKCKRLKRALRIGTNHGSLSDRIMNYHGDTPKGMVESALEFARICRKNDYHDFIFSMKASNPLVMVQAYRLLVQEMYELGWDYPLHLGVTEAGEGEDGRIKSAMGIGSLLLDGLGDTIRVSLTEDPWCEIDPCQRLVRLAQKHEIKKGPFFEEKHRSIERYERRCSGVPSKTCLHRDGSVGVFISTKEMILRENFFEHLGLVEKSGLLQKQLNTVDFVIIDKLPDDEQAKDKIFKLQQLGVAIWSRGCEDKLLKIQSLQTATKPSALKIAKPGDIFIIEVKDEKSEEWQKILKLKPDCILFTPTLNPFHQARCFADWLKDNDVSVPLILHFAYQCERDDLIMEASMEMGAVLCDGLADGVVISGPLSLHPLRVMGFNILQAARMRTSKTEFISCPGCGRTLFNLQKVSEQIRERTAHLPGVKIAIMGCIVNGPGEMADADFGYVGSKPNKIDLYVGKKCVEKDIEFAEAPDRLVQLIKDNGRWIDKC